MSEALSNNQQVERSSGAVRAQEPRRSNQENNAIDYATFASLAQGAGEISALARSGASVATKASESNLPGMAGRDRGTSSRLMPGRGSAVQALGSSGDATSNAIQEMKQMSSRHDPASRLSGQVPDESGVDASKGGVEHADHGGRAAKNVDVGASDKPAPVQSNAANAGTNAAGNAAASGSPQAANAVAQSGAGVATQAAGRTTGVDAKAAVEGVRGVDGARSSVPAGAPGAKTGEQGAGSSGTNTNAAATARGVAVGRGLTFSIEARTAGLKAKAAEMEAQGKPVEAQAVRGLAAVLRQKGGNVTLRLAPEALGDLKVTMKLDGAQVWASIEATTESARQLLEGQRDSLREALEAHGLKVERLDVSAVKHESGSEPRRAGVKDHADAPHQGLSSGMDGSSHAGEDRRSEEGWGRTPREFAMGGSARVAGEMDAGGAGEMLVTVRGAPVNVWMEPQGQTMRLRVDAVV